MPVYVNGQEYEDEFQLTLGRPTQQEQSPSEGKDSYHQLKEQVDPTQYDTKLSSEDELKFNAWKLFYAPNDSGMDYDFRGAYKAGLVPSDNGHWPDTFKKPNHPTFSIESQYAQDRPDLAGSWQGETFIPPTDPFAIAAKRTSEAVKPAAGRSEGGITKAIDNAVPHTVESIKNMVTFPSEYVNFMTEMSKKKELTEEDQFKINQMQDQMVKWGADTGINLGTGGVATAPMREAGVGVFGGRIGATALGKNNLLDAYKLEHIGANPTDIWFKTGWYRGTDGKFRFEIPDTNATVNLNRFQKIEKKDATPPDWTSASTDTQTHTYVFPEDLKLKDIYDHPDLYKAYPHLKDVQITEIPKDSHAIADASSAENTIRLSQKAFENPDFIKTVLTHEIQHMIQAEERFAKGASYISDPKKFQTPFDSHMEIVNRDIDKIQEYLDKGGRMNPAQQEYMHKLLDIQQAFKDYKDSALKLAEVNYKRSAGEVEARTAMRRTKNPNAVDDIPPQDQLVHFKSELFAPHGLVTGIGKPR